MPFPECHIHKVIYYVAFTVWLSNVHLLTHVKITHAILDTCLCNYVELFGSLVSFSFCALESKCIAKMRGSPGGSVVKILPAKQEI